MEWLTWFLDIQRERVALSFISSNSSTSILDLENSENQACSYPCFHCDKVFTNYRALGGHNKTHNLQISSSTRRDCPSRSSTSTNLNALFNNQPANSSWGAGNNLTISERSTPNDAIPMNATFAPSGSTSASSYPSDPKLCLGSNEVCHFNTDEKQTCRDGRPLFCGDALENFQLNFSIPVLYRNLGLDLNQSPGFEETNTVGFSPVDPRPFSGWDESCQSKIQSYASYEEHKVLYSVDGLADTTTTRASKRPKIFSHLPVIGKSLIKEPPLFKDVKYPFSKLGVSFESEQEGPADLDLSLHL